jgi:hypothetical protein
LKNFSYSWNSSTPSAASTATRVPSLAFDHADILQIALERLRGCTGSTSENTGGSPRQSSTSSCRSAT